MKKYKVPVLLCLGAFLFGVGAAQTSQAMPNSGNCEQRYHQCMQTDPTGVSCWGLKATCDLFGF